MEPINVTTRRTASVKYLDLSRYSDETVTMTLLGDCQYLGTSGSRESYTATIVGEQVPATWPGDARTNTSARLQGGPVAEAINLLAELDEVRAAANAHASREKSETEIGRYRDWQDRMYAIEREVSEVESRVDAHPMTARVAMARVAR